MYLDEKCTLQAFEEKLTKLFGAGRLGKASTSENGVGLVLYYFQHPDKPDHRGLTRTHVATYRRDSKEGWVFDHAVKFITQ